MTFPAGSRPAPAPRPARRRRRGALVPTLAVLAGIVLVVLVLAQVWTEVLWYRQLGYSQVLWTQWGTRAGLFVLGFLAMGGAVYASMTYAYRARPVYAPSDPEQANLDQYREAIEPLRRLVGIVGPLVLGLFAAGAAASQWETVQLFLHRSAVGTTDPQYGLDLGFYFFTLPLLRFVVSFVLAVAILAAIVAVATHYLYGGLRIGGPAGQPRMTRAARAQLFSIGAVVMVAVAANYWLDRYSILMKNSQGAKFAGASYTDVTAVIPAKAILAIAALVVAAAFVVAAVRGNWRLPALGVGAMVVAAVAIGGIYPAIVQRFTVQPNQQDAESQYIQRNIDATSTAYGLNNIETTEYDAKVTAQAGQLREDADTTASIRLLDPSIVSPSFKQLQQIRGFYSFPDTLSVDRYDVGNQSRDTVIAVRELDQSGLSSAQQNWVNQTTVYTHWFGVVAAYGNTVTTRGAPAFWEGGIPSTGSMGSYEPRVYFGQSSPAYSIVGGPDGTTGWELDYPTDSNGGAANTRFPTQTVSAGPSIGSLWNKLLYAIKFGDEQILFSDRVNADSQILYDRDPAARVQKVAPYLTLDGRVYPAVVDGRIKWIVDGYTTTDEYPYSASESLDSATTDSLTQTSATVTALQPQTVNYIRNSVKATVDAYDGSVQLYTWDADDPILKAWSGVFPGSVKPMSQISGDLMSHLRYPEDLFKVQRTLLAKYHVQDAAQFFSGNDFWQLPADPVHTGAPVAQPPYYLTLRMPTQDSATFSLMSTFIPSGSTAREVLTGYVAVDADAGSTAGQKSPDYGKIRLLELPRDSTVPGPGQASANFINDSTISQQLNLLEQASSTVRRGNLLTLPVGGGLLYVQPVYVQASSGTTFPSLQRVLVSFGDQTGFAATLSEALDQVFQGDSGAKTGDTSNVPTVTPSPEATPTPTPSPSGTATPTPSGTASPAPSPTSSDALAQAKADLASALADANQAIKDGQTALANNDFAAYGEAQKRLDSAIQRATDAQNRIG